MNLFYPDFTLNLILLLYLYSFHSFYTCSLASIWTVQHPLSLSLSYNSITDK